MVIPTSGAINLNNIHTDGVGGASGSAVSMNDSDIRGLIGKGSGATMSMSEWYLNPPTYISSGSSQNTSTTSTLNVYTNCNSGDLIVVSVGWRSSGELYGTTRAYGRLTNLGNAGQNKRRVTTGKLALYNANDCSIRYRIANRANDYFTMPVADRYSTAEMCAWAVYRPAKTISNLSWTTTGTTSNDTTDAPTTYSASSASGKKNNVLFVSGAVGHITAWSTSLSQRVLVNGDFGNQYRMGIAAGYDPNGGTYTTTYVGRGNDPANMITGYLTFR